MEKFGGYSVFTRVRRTLCHHLSLDWTSLWTARWPVSLSQNNLGLPAGSRETLDERSQALSALSLTSPWLTRAYNVPSRRTWLYIFILDAINNTAYSPPLHVRH